ncbi:MAG: T9SS type A sorting domain-containing protein [Bacteroidetes bacterium]|nr:T9SS type A sorting domain-containing protein [Bacteroidota bacterium]
MKKIYLFAILNLFVALSQAQNVQWAKAEGLWAYDYGYGIQNDNAGNVYVAGKYELNGANFSGTTVTCAGNHDCFLAKYSPSGGLIWIRTAGGGMGDYWWGTYTDGTSAVYAAGEIEYSNIPVTFPGSAVTFTPKGDNDIVFAKYDLNGNLLWAKQEGSFYNEKALGITADASGNVFICGYYADTIIFNGVQYPSLGSKDLFVAKYNSSGAFQWVKKAGGPGRDEAKAIKCDAAGNVYICGMYSNNAIFGAQTLTCTPGFYEAYLAKYDTNGNLVWVKKGGGDYDDVAWSLTIDPQNKIYVTGEYIGYGVFGGFNVTTAGGTDVFVASYDANGTELWLKSAGGSLIDRARGITTNGTDLFITGQFGATAAFGTNSVTAADSSDVFISALNNSGSFLWTSAAGGMPDSVETLGYESGIAICAEANGNVYATGSILTGAVFGNITLQGYKRTDVFVTKLNGQPAAPPNGLNENTNAENFSVYPNPSNGNLNFDLSRYGNKQVEIAVYNTMGKLIDKKIFKAGTAVSLDLTTQANGMYFAEVKADGQLLANKKIMINK